MKQLTHISWLQLMLLAISIPLCGARTSRTPGLDLQHMQLAPLTLSNWMVSHGYPCTEVLYQESGDRLNGRYSFRGDGILLRRGEQAVTAVFVKAGKVTMLCVTWDAPASATLVSKLRTHLVTRLGQPQAAATTPDEPPYGACRTWHWKPAGRIIELTASVHPYLCILSVE